MEITLRRRRGKTEEGRECEKLKDWKRRARTKRAKKGHRGLGALRDKRGQEHLLLQQRVAACQQFEVPVREKDAAVPDEGRDVQDAFTRRRILSMATCGYLLSAMRGAGYWGLRLHDRAGRRNEAALRGGGRGKDPGVLSTL